MPFKSKANSHQGSAFGNTNVQGLGILHSHPCAGLFHVHASAQEQRQRPTSAWASRRAKASGKCQGFSKHSGHILEGEDGPTVTLS